MVRVRRTEQGNAPDVVRLDKSDRRWLVSCGFSLVGALLGGAWWLSATNANLSNQVANLSAEIVELKSLRNDVVELKVEVGKIKATLKKERE